MHEIDASEVDPRERARILKSAVAPRPIAWISTTSEDGVDNLAPFSSYNYVGSSQPVVLFTTPNGSTGELKDTPRNALETGEFAVNVVTEPLIEQMDRTSANLPTDESEFEFAGVERAECRLISPPRVAEAVVTMECTLHDSVELYDRLLILGDVRYFHISEAVLTDGVIDSRLIDSVGRLGGPYYTSARPMDFERQS